MDSGVGYTPIRLEQLTRCGVSVTFAYDPDSLLTQAGAISLGRDAQTGFVTGTTLGSLTDTRRYSTFGELASYQATVGTAPLLATQYTRDGLGRITEKTETVGGVTDTSAYTYDLAGRLTEVRKNGALIASYAYDANSNRTSRTTPSGTVTGSYDAQDRLLAYGDATYSYTANGELASQATPAGTTTYQYDVVGNLLSVTLPNGTRIDYVIDGRNRRIGKKVNGTLVQGFLYRNRLKPVAELDGTGAVVARFVYGSSPIVPDYLVKGGTTYRIISDHLGSPRLVVDTATETVVQRLDYDEFGQITLDTNPGFQPFGFAGGLYDPHTKLTRFGVRDYDAETGRWTATDPSRFAGGDTNLYGYAIQDPVQFLDPLGLEPQVDNTALGAGLIAAGAGAVGAGVAHGAAGNIILGSLTAAHLAASGITGEAALLEVAHGFVAAGSVTVAGVVLAGVGGFAVGQGINYLVPFLGEGRAGLWLYDLLNPERDLFLPPQPLNPTPMPLRPDLKVPGSSCTVPASTR